MSAGVRFRLAAALMLPALLCLPAAAAAGSDYWYDGHRRVPLSVDADVAAPLQRSAATGPLFRAAAGGPPRGGDGTFYVCYPDGWDAARIAALEARYALRRSPRAETEPGVRFYRQPDLRQALELANRIFEENDLACAAPLWTKRLVAKSLDPPDDPLFSLQWHLRNTGQCTGTAGEDIGALEAWEHSLGAGVTIAVVDDGVEMTHPDLAPNLAPFGHYDYLAGTPSPAAGSHGTAVAGIAAGRGFNGIGLSGAAPAAALLALRLLPEDDAFIDEAAEAAALGYTAAPVAVFNNSWGPTDDSTSAFERPSPLTRAAIERRIREGRGGLGSIYVWAAGNGGHADDSNLDGYANSRYAIAVTATTCAGLAASYAESGSNILVAAPSGDGDIGLLATDRLGFEGYNTGFEFGELFDLDYTNSFSGTSGSVPVVSGTVALMLATNAQLSWRDVRQVLALSAEPTDAFHPWWRVNAAGLPVNEQYGFGRVDAAAAVGLAAAWGETAAAEQVATAFTVVNQPIPDVDPRGVSSTLQMDESLRVESVIVTVDIPDHSYWGDIAVYLTSPSGTRVRLAREHFITPDAQGLGYRQWMLHDTLHLGEVSRGEWTIEVSDNFSGDTGTFASWSLAVYGTAIPDTPARLPVSCTAVSLSRPGVTGPDRLALGVNRHGGAWHGEVEGSRLEDYRLLVAAGAGAPVAEQLAVALYQPPGGGLGWFQLSGSGWKGWDGDPDSLNGFANPAGQVATLHAGRLAEGSYTIWNGYRAPGGEIFACIEPLRVTVGE